ncbi:hypothetical protein EMCRGX_G019771 [Ephydatia muelleri]
MAGYGEGFLNRLCQEGKLQEVQDYINKLDTSTLAAKQCHSAGPLQYTPLHEAAANGHTSLVDLLVTCGADINCRSKGGHTPLHLAAKWGHSETVQILLRYKADLSLTDGFGKTAKQVAEANSKGSVVRVLHSEEIVREAESGCELLVTEENENRRATGNKRLTQLLHDSPDGLEEDCPYTSQALVAAVLNDCHTNVAILANFCTDLAKIDNALHFARNLGKYKSHATLLLVKAVLLRDRLAIEVLFGEHDRPAKLRAGTAPPLQTTPPRESPLPRCRSAFSFSTSRSSSQEWSFVAMPSPTMTTPTLDTLQCEENLVPVVGALATNQVSAAVALPSAMRNVDLPTMGELLWRVGVDWKQGEVAWFDLGLPMLSQEWLYRIRWVRTLNLAHNKLRNLADDMHLFLTKVAHLDLKHNDLSAVPPCLLTLPNLKRLDLSHNSLTSLPELPKWSTTLSTLLLSHNSLGSIPGKPTAVSLSELDLSHNRLLEVPHCIANMRSLRSLDLAFNPITSLPSSMAKLKSLTRLNLEGLRIRNVPRQAQKDAQHCVRSISIRQPGNHRPFPQMRVCVLGKPKRGKSSLVAHLLGREPSQTQPSSLEVCDLEVKSFGKRPVQFTVWDFSGSETLHGMHQCYLSKRTMCLVLFNLKHGREGVEEVKYWLDSIARRSTEVCVVVVGTHLDLVADKERSSVSDLVQEVVRLGTSYASRVALKQVLAVGLKNHIENVAMVKSAMYQCAAEHHVGTSPGYRGRGVEHRYVMTKSEFRDLLRQLKILDDLEEEGGEGELSAALFLMDMGCLTHFNTSFYNLRDLYWMDVQWLYSTLAKVSCGQHEEALPIAEEGPLGLLESCVVSTEFIAPILREAQFPRHHYDRFAALLTHLKVAFPLDSQRLFVPGLLPKAMLERRDDEYFRCVRYIAFKGREPPGFWNQLLYQIVWFVPQVRRILERLTFRKGRESYELVLPTLPLPELLVQPKDGAGASPTDAQLHLWQCGVFYEDRDVTFRVQPIAQQGRNYQVESLSLSLPRMTKEGVSIACTCNDFGKRVFVQLVSLVHGLLEQWDPVGSSCSSSSTADPHTVTCPECINKLPGWPFEFEVKQCLEAAASGQQTIDCNRDSQGTHAVSLGNLVPELHLLHKLPNAFQSTTELALGRQLAIGEGVQTYQGHFRGRPVTVMRFLEPLGIRGMTNEATYLQALSHPNIATFAGINVSTCTVLTEGTPLGTLHTLLYEDQVAIPRLVVHRMAFQVSSAIQYLHARGIALRDVKTEGVLVWSLTPAAPKHCALANLERCAPCSNAGCASVKSSSSVPGMGSPETSGGEGGAGEGRCDASTDIFSFAMLFYQVMSRQHPYHHLPLEGIDEALRAGERPELCDVSSSDAMFFYVSRLLRSCWTGDPQSRPTADRLVDVTVRTVVHSVMAVVPIAGPRSLRCACVTPPVPPHGSRELWVCSESSAGTEVDVYDLDTMTKVGDTFLRDFQALGICACGRYAWISPRGGNSTDVYDVRYRESVGRVPLEFLSCMTSSEGRVFCGTAEGECLAFSTDQGYFSPACDPDAKCSLGKAVLSVLACGGGALWVSVEHRLLFLDSDTLVVVGSSPWPDDVVLSQLSLSDDGTVVWGAQLLGATLSAWDARTKTHMYSVDTRGAMKDISPGMSDSDAVITAIAAVLDTVWVGMATGHILQFHGRELVSWFQPYDDYIRLLLRVPSLGGPDQKTCEAKVLSGGKRLKAPLVASDFKEYEPVDLVGNPLDSAGVLILWEAFPGEVSRQTRALERDHLERVKSNLVDNLTAVDEVKVPLPQIGMTEEFRVPHRLGSVARKEIPITLSSPELLEETLDLSRRPLSDRLLGPPRSADRVTSIATSVSESLYEYLESPLRSTPGQPGDQIGSKSFMEDTLAVSPLAGPGRVLPRERTTSITDTIYDYPVFPSSSPASPEHSSTDLQSCWPTELCPSTWASEGRPLPTPDHQPGVATQLPGSNDDDDGYIQQYPLDTDQLQTENIYSQPDEN